MRCKNKRLQNVMKYFILFNIILHFFNFFYLYLIYCIISILIKTFSETVGLFTFITDNIFLQQFYGNFIAGITIRVP